MTLTGKVAWKTKELVYKRTGVRMADGAIRARGDSPSDVYVFDEIFGAEDAYRRDVIVPIMQGGTVVEVGAHKGYFTVLAASVADRVIVFEPDDKNHAFLRKNVDLNGGSHVTVVREAVSDTAGTRTFTVSKVTDARHTFFPTSFSGAGQTVQVQCTTLAAALDDHGVERVALLKLDCEGSEYDVLLGCDRATMDRIDNIALEIHESPVIPHARADLLAFLDAHGFVGDLYDEHDRDGLRTCMGLFRRAT